MLKLCDRHSKEKEATCKQCIIDDLRQKNNTLTLKVMMLQMEVARLTPSTDTTPYASVA